MTTINNINSKKQLQQLLIVSPLELFVDQRCRLNQVKRFQEIKFRKESLITVDQELTVPFLI